MELEEKIINNSVNTGHYVCHAAHLQSRTGNARTSLGPKAIFLPATFFFTTRYILGFTFNMIDPTLSIILSMEKS